MVHAGHSNHLDQLYMLRYPVYPLQPPSYSWATAMLDTDLHSSACDSLAEILTTRATGILQTAESTGKQLRVLWSGGIDTTAMVIAFYNITKSDTSRRERITICYCERSQAEYPAFWLSTISQFKKFQIPQHVRDIFSECNDVSLVTGDPADMMFGTYVMSQCVLDPPTLRPGGPLSPLYMQLEGHWRIFSKFMVYKGLLSEEATEYWLQWIEPFVAKSPIPVLTVFDFLWWCSYGLKYQHDLNRIFYNNSHQQIPSEMVARMVNFYDTQEFSQWSYHFHQSKMKNKTVWASYKHALKDFIFKFNGDQTYYGAKLKVQSVSNNWGFEHGLDTNYNLIR